MVNQFYLRDEVGEQLRQALTQDPDLPSVALGEFLTEETLALLDKETSAGWTHETVPDRYAHATRDRVALQDAIGNFVRNLTGEQPLAEPNRRFQHRDFTLMHDEEEEPAGVLGMLFLDDIPEEAGGSVVFMRDGELLGRFTPARNTLLIVRRNKGVRQFVHYVNHRIGKKSFRVISA